MIASGEKAGANLVVDGRGHTVPGKENGFFVGPTLIENVASLRLKETDRLAALETELRKLGVVAKAGADSLLITPTASLRGASIATYDDHRMAMAFALAGFRIAGIEIQDPGCVAKTWPGFFSELDAMRESSR